MFAPKPVVVKDNGSGEGDNAGEEKGKLSTNYLLYLFQKNRQRSRLLSKRRRMQCFG
jgi:hypothetical protein